MIDPAAGARYTALDAAAGAALAAGELTDYEAHAAARDALRRQSKRPVLHAATARAKPVWFRASLRGWRS